MQDGRLSTTFIWNLYGAITLYWIVILTSIFFYFVPEVTPKNVKVLKITENYRILPKTSKNSLHWSITVYWIEIFTSILFYFVTEVSPKRFKVPKITHNYWKLPEVTENIKIILPLVHNSVLHYDIDFNYASAQWAGGIYVFVLSVHPSAPLYVCLSVNPSVHPRRFFLCDN